MNDALHAYSWPLADLGTAMEALATWHHLSTPAQVTPVPPSDVDAPGDDRLAAWVATAANAVGVDSEPAEVRYADVNRFLSNTGPALLRLPAEDEPRFVALVKTHRRAVSVLGPDLELHRVRTETVQRCLSSPVEKPALGEIDRLLDEAKVPERRRSRTRDAILRERLRGERLSDCWVLRLPSSSPFWRQMQRAGMHRRMAVLVGAHALQYLLWITSWWVVGRAALGGHLDRGTFLAWGLLLLTLVPVRLLVTWSQGVFAVGTGGLLKKRLLHGALRLNTEHVRQQGAGQLLGRVLESEAVESLALSGGVLGLVAALELFVAAAILWIGAGGPLHAILLWGWVLCSVLIARRYYVQRGSWTHHRLGMTHDLIERMVGHRTRLAQEARERWHEGEDEALAHSLKLSQSMDRTAVQLMGLVPRGWIVLGLLGFVPAFVSGQSSQAELAIGLGGTLLAFGALEKLARGLWHFAGAGIAWKQVAPLFHAAAQPQNFGTPSFTPPVGNERDSVRHGGLLLDANELVFRYREGGAPVLRGCTLQVRYGDRILLEGQSGGGKSTLTSLLAGLRLPESGVLLLGGLDRQTLGMDGWLRRVAAAPQFHENHVLAETFAFNLLMSRRWPPNEEDMQEAESICRALGLGELLDRMPAGILQLVGETGWQLSHGERSRLYIARALLQATDLVILDESFAALDPENLRRCLQCVLERAPTLIVVAHP